MCYGKTKVYSTDSRPHNKSLCPLVFYLQVFTIPWWGFCSSYSQKINSENKVTWAKNKNHFFFFCFGLIREWEVVKREVQWIRLHLPFWGPGFVSFVLQNSFVTWSIQLEWPHCAKFCLWHRPLVCTISMQNYPVTLFSIFTLIKLHLMIQQYLVL